MRSSAVLVAVSVAVSFMGALGSAFAAKAAPASASKETPLATLVVDAGYLDRERSPVAVPLPPSVASAKALRLTDERGRPIPATAAEGTLHFVVPALAKGKKAHLRLYGAESTASAGERVTIERGAEALIATVDGAPIFHFRTKAPEPTAEVPARYLRAGYLHPVFSPRGVLVTDDSPEDHRHHHGVWTAWTVAEYEGRRLSFWGPEPGKSKNDLVSVGQIWQGDAAAGFSAKLASSDLGVKPPKQILDSAWKVVVYRTHDRRPPYFLFDLEWTDKVVGDKPLRLPEYRYGGLGVRGHRDWIDGLAMTFLTSEGKGRLEGENTRARWVYLGGTVGKKKAGLSVLVHPLNMRAPQPVRLNPGIPLLVVSPPKAGDMAIEPDHPYSVRYRFVVTDGPPNPKLLERLWRDYARTPKVEVELAGAKTASVQ